MVLQSVSVTVFICNQHIQCLWPFAQNLTLKNDQDTHNIKNIQHRVWKEMKRKRDTKKKKEIKVEQKYVEKKTKTQKQACSYKSYYTIYILWGS